MSNKKAILTGTFILSLSGFLSRLLGFYNRIFLSRTIGAKEIGIYQFVLTFYMLAFTLCCHGLETALSNVIAKHHKDCSHTSLSRFLRRCILFSALFSLLLSGILWILSGFLPFFFPAEENCGTILQITSYSLPFVAVKSCLRSYYIGQKKSGIPATSQLIEQIFRVLCIYILIMYYQVHPDARVAAWGMVCGEILSSLFMAISYLISHRRKKKKEIRRKHSNTTSSLMSEYLEMGIPLSIQHFSLTAFGSIEAILLPLVLTRYLNSQSDALTLYGILTGMSIPFLFFPATITNSLSVMLLPSIAESYKEKKMTQIHRTISYSIHYCMIIGILGTFAFLLYGPYLGGLLFHNETAGTLIRQFSCLCPLMYLSQTSTSMLNGFSKTKITLRNSLLSICIRILSLCLLVPSLGIPGYLAGLILGYSILLFLNLRSIHQVSPICFSPLESLLLPMISAIASGHLSLIIYDCLSNMTSLPVIWRLGISGSLYIILFLFGIFVSGCFRKNS